MGQTAALAVLCMCLCVAAPGAPENVTAVGVSPSSVTVGWDPPSPPLSRIASYTVRGASYYPLTVSASEACSSDSGVRPRCRARVTGLREDTEYTLTVSGSANAAELFNQT